jgi:hypothetical protein
MKNEDIFIRNILSQHQFVKLYGVIKFDNQIFECVPLEKIDDEKELD